MEMIRLVEQSDLSVRSTLRQLGIAPSTFDTTNAGRPIGMPMSQAAVPSSTSPATAPWAAAATASVTTIAQNTKNGYISVPSR